MESGDIVGNKNDFNFNEGLSKLVETVGGIIAPDRMERIIENNTKAKQKLLDGAIKKVSENPGLTVKVGDIEVSGSSIAGMVNSEERKALARAAVERQINTAMKEQANLEAVAQIAAKQLAEDGGKTSEKPVDEDWSHEFFDGAKRYSNETVRQIWGKILASEIKNPGSFSQRTLNILRNISVEYANTFRTLCKFGLVRSNDVFILSTELTKYGFSYDKYIELEQMGLFYSSSTLNLTIKNNSMGNSTVLLNTTDKHNILLLDGYTGGDIKFQDGLATMTEPGRELFSITECNEPPPLEYIRSIKTHMNLQGSYTLKLAEVIGYNKADKTWRFRTDNVISL